MSNFSYFKDRTEYKSFIFNCIEAEETVKKYLDSSIKSSRKALELAVKWVYKNDKRLDLYKNLQKNAFPNLYTMTTDNNFKNLIGSNLSDKVDYIRKIGNSSAHTSNTIDLERKAIHCLENLFDFIQWIEKNYNSYNYKNKSFDVDKIPSNSEWKKYAIGAIGGALGILALIFIGDNNKKY